LREIGPAANEATPQLLEILRANVSKSQPSGNPSDRRHGDYGSKGMGYGGEGFEGNDLWKDTVLALGRARALQAIPELTAMLRDESLDANAKQFIVVSLGEIGPAAKTAINDLKAIAGGSRDPNSDKITKLQSAAVVAISRIRLPYATKLIPSILRKIKKNLDVSGYGGMGGYGDSDELGTTQEIYFVALMWLGGKEDPEIMMHTATLGWNNVGHGRPSAYRQLLSSTLLPRISHSIWNAIKEHHDPTGTGNPPAGADGGNTEQGTASVCSGSMRQEAFRKTHIAR
jgi:hypothetical protein